MNPTTQKWLSRILTGLACLLIAAGAITQLAAIKKVDTDMSAVGVGNYYRAIGGLKLLGILLYLYPATFRIGFLLVTCILAGAMATLLSHGQSMFAPAVPLTIFWIATFVRNRSIFLNPPHSSPG